ncbi:MAG: hypothetical protein ACKVVT_12655 [Dehalococcoidia bacterium]
MRVGLILEFSPKKGETLGTLLRTVMAAAPGLSVGFLMRETPVEGQGTACVARVTKRFPEMAQFQVDLPNGPGLPGSRPALSNMAAGGVPASPAPIETLVAIADGVPRSFPFHMVTMTLQSPEFGEPAPISGPMRVLNPGIILQDSWWVSGRQRSAVVTAVVEGDPKAKGLPPLPPALEAVVKALGKPRSKQNFPIPDPATATEPVVPGFPRVGPPANPEVAQLVDSFRARYQEWVAALALPHVLPDVRQLLASRLSGGFGEKPGPMKPALVEAFKPLGYDCKARSGTYTLRRRTPTNHIVEIHMDVGTWSQSYLGFYKLLAPGGRVTIGLPAGPGMGTPAVQYPIGGPEGWQQIVDNLAVIVEALDRELAAPVCAAWGPAPEWFDPAG